MKDKHFFVEDNVMARNQIENLRSDPKYLAEFMHNFYEKESKKKGWTTQKITRVEFKDLPKENKAVMIALAKKLIKLFGENK